MITVNFRYNESGPSFISGSAISDPNHDPFDSRQPFDSESRDSYENQKADWPSRYPGTIYRQGSSEYRLAALTFDDAPDSLFAPVLLEILGHYRVKATFFCQGDCVQKNQGMVERIAKEGHILANHTFHHPDLTTLRPEQIRAEIQSTETEIYRVTGLRTKLFRPPYGALNDESAQVALAMGYKLILWNVDSMDWSGISGPTITARVVANMVPGSIILMHNACTGSVQAGSGMVQSLPYIIEILKEQGYHFVTVPEMLSIPAY